MAETTSIVQEVTTVTVEKVKKPRRKADRKFANPSNLEQTWSKRGRQPAWVKEALATGKTLDDLRNPALAA